MTEMTFMPESSSTPESVLSYGQKQVGQTFNPSGKAEVNAIKNAAAALIDELHAQRSKASSAGLSGEILAQYTLAIRNAEDASYRGVKAATWQY